MKSLRTSASPRRYSEGVNAIWLAPKSEESAVLPGGGEAMAKRRKEQDNRVELGFRDAKAELEQLGFLLPGILRARLADPSILSVAVAVRSNNFLMSYFPIRGP